MRFLAPFSIATLAIASTALYFYPETSQSSAKEEGKFYGAKMTEYPDWFKESFLDINEDIAEAREAGKRVAIFFHQDGCPYCNALVERNLAQKAVLEKAKNNFDFIALNMWGDRMVTYVNGKQYKEKDLALALKVQFTPTIMFYDEKGKIVLRLNGYRSPTKFMADMDYVIATKTKKVKYLDFLKTSLPQKAASKELNNQNFFQPAPYNLKQYKDAGKLSAVIFEQKDCPDCDTLHNKVIPDKTLRKIMDQFKIVQLDMWSNTKVITPEGKTKTARDWANELDIKFAPSIVVFNEAGKEIIRTEGSFKVFHTQGIFDYVLSGSYKNQPSFQRYLTDRADHIREQGKDVDIWNYADQKPGDRI
ncbi:thioredoxin family protein [Kaarinaea lacus]